MVLKVRDSNNFMYFNKSSILFKVLVYLIACIVTVVNAGVPKEIIFPNLPILFGHHEVYYSAFKVAFYHHR